MAATEPTDAHRSELLPWHRQIWQRLNGQRAAGRLPHALLLHGPRGLGKERFANLFARSLVCESPGEDGGACARCRPCRLADLGNHPDIRWVRPEEEGGQIRVDSVREACRQAVLAADYGHHRTFLFSPAEQMSPGAANALLKTLEEPVEWTLILLISDAPQRLPATVRSRCQQVLFRAPDRQAALDWLDGAADPAAFGAALALAGGAPLEAAALLDHGLPARIQAMQEDLVALAQGREGPVEVAARWQDQPLARILEVLQLLLADLIRLKSGGHPPICYFEAAQDRLHALAEPIDSQRLFAFSDLVYGARREAARNLNPQLLTERLLIDWCRTARSERT